MDNSNILLDLLNRVIVLEKKVEVLENGSSIENLETVTKVTTSDIRKYIEDQKKSAKEEGKESIDMVANSIHKALGLKNSMPMVCNAMRQCMNDDDEVISETQSGQSSTLNIKYNLNFGDIKTGNEWDVITKEDVLKAIEMYRYGDEGRRGGVSTFLMFNGKKYPAKYIRGQAYKVHYDKEINPRDYYGGMETKRFFEKIDSNLFSIDYKPIPHNGGQLLIVKRENN